MHGERASPTAASFALWGAAWAVVAGLLAAAGLVQVAEASGAPWPPSAVGRLQSAYMTAILLGAAAMPLGGAILEAAGARPGRWFLRLWNLCLVVGLLAVLAGGLESESAVPAAWAAASVALVFAWWTVLVYGSAAAPSVEVQSGNRTLPATGAHEREGEPGWLALALVAGVGLSAGLLVLGPWLAPDSVAPGVGVRTLTSLGLVPAAWAAAAIALSRAGVGDCLKGRVTVLAAAAWVPLAILASARLATPDLVPRWLALAADASAAAATVPAAVIALAFTGAVRRAGPVRTEPLPPLGRNGHPARAERRSPPEAPRRFSAHGRYFALAGVLLLTAAITNEGLLQGRAREAVRFTSWDGTGALFPPFAGLLLVAAACAAQASGDQRRARVALAAAAITAFLAAVPLWPAGLTEAAGGWTAGTDRAAALLRLPWALALAVTAGLQFGSLVPAARGDGAPGPASTDPAADSNDWPPRARTVGYALASLAAGLFLLLFVPAAAGPGEEGRAAVASRGAVDPDLAETGRRIYVRDGCAACHTLRVLPEDAASGRGPQTGNLTPAGRASPGWRRGGPDLAWVGDRYPAASEMADRLGVHGPEGPAAPHEWLFRPSLTVEGAAVAAYLRTLRSEVAR